jgi:uncharacterized protein (TIGR02466 family)
MKNHVDLFPVPIARYHKDDHEDLRIHFLNILEQYPKEQAYCDSPGLVHFFQNGDLDLRQYPEFHDFHEWILNSVKDYAQSFFGIISTEFLDLNVWINANVGGFQHPHNHGNSLFSATYYIQLDPSIHSGLEFHNPRSPSSLFKPYIDFIGDRETEYTKHKHGLAVTQGDLLIWPSELMHGYDQQQVNVPRISMSMNFLPETVKSHVYGFKISKL